MRISVPLVLSLFVTLSAPLRAQAVPVGDPLEDYARLMQLTGALPVTAVSARPATASLAGLLVDQDALAQNPWHAALQARLRPAGTQGLQVQLLPLDLRSSFNSARPWGVNDAALWQGRGTTLSAQAGVTAAWRRFSVAFRPMVTRATNGSFALNPIAVTSGHSRFAYPTGSSQSLDMPQRFGDGSFSTWDLGQSFVRAEIGPAAAGLSTENLWWGPSRRNSITMSNNAPGFAHIFAGTARPANIGIGRLDTRWVAGQLRESQFFDSLASNDRRFITGIVATLSPRGLPGLEIGATRTFISAWSEGGPALDEVLRVFLPLQKVRFATPTNPSGDDATDQMASVFFRYALPANGFELYGEWGRGDHSWDLRDVMVEPEHASGWMLGAQKSFLADEAEGRFWRLGAELILLGGARTTQLRAPPSSFYVHHIVKQGFTQRGQLMGAGIGPGGSQFWTGVDRFARWGRIGVGLQRTVYDNDRLFRSTGDFLTAESEPALLLDALVFRGPLDLSASIAYAKLLNKWYVDRNDEANLHLNVGVRYTP